MRIAIVGAGLAGLSCADELTGAGHHVVLFDKGRGPGGRMSTRRIKTVLGEVSVDHGTPYLTVRDSQFRAAVGGWEQQGLVQQWPAGGIDSWVGVPNMNAVVKNLASRHETHWNTFVQGLAHEGGQWRIATDTGLHGPFEALIVATPAEQAVPLLSLHDLAMARTASLAWSKPCWVGAFIFAEALDTTAHFLRDRGPMALAICNRIKPQRAEPECWVVHANTDWSMTHLEAPAAEVAQNLLAALLDALALPQAAPIEVMAHRWRYARPPEGACETQWNPSIALGACGDWQLGPRAECAWLSGRALARTALKSWRAPVAVLRA